jgi:hypothetical protein
MKMRRIYLRKMAWVYGLHCTAFGSLVELGGVSGGVDDQIVFLDLVKEGQFRTGNIYDTQAID